MFKNYFELMEFLMIILSFSTIFLILELLLIIFYTPLLGLVWVAEPDKVLVGELNKPNGGKYEYLAGLSWKTKKYRTEELRPGCFSIHH